MCKSHIPYLVPGIITDPTRQICTIHIHNKSRGIHIPPAKYGVPRRSRKNKKRKKSCRSNRWRNTCLEKSRSWNGDLIRPMSAERGYGWATYIWQKNHIPFTIFVPLFLSLLLMVVPQIRGHIARSSPSSPLRFGLCIFIARRLQTFLPWSTRVELGLLTLGAHSSWSFFFNEIHDLTTIAFELQDQR